MPPVHLPTTHGGGFTLPIFLLNDKQESCEKKAFIVFGLARPIIELQFSVVKADALFTGSLMGSDMIIKGSFNKIRSISCVNKTTAERRKGH